MERLPRLEGELQAALRRGLLDGDPARPRVGRPSVGRLVRPAAALDAKRLESRAGEVQDAFRPRGTVPDEKGRVAVDPADLRIGIVPHSGQEPEEALRVDDDGRE